MTPNDALLHQHNVHLLEFACKLVGRDVTQAKEPVITTRCVKCVRVM